MKVSINEQIVRLELVTGQFESIDWSRDGNSDYYFLIETGELAGNFLRVEGSLIIGSGSDQKTKKGYLLLFEDPSLSLDHTKVRVDPSDRRVYVEDQGSETGTWLALIKDIEEKIGFNVLYKSE